MSCSPSEEIVALSGERDAEAGADLDLRTCEDERLGECIVDAGGEWLDLRRVVEVFAQDDGLVSG